VRRNHHKLPDDVPRKVVVYATEEERLEAKRIASRESKRRKAEEKAKRTSALEDFFKRIEGTGSPERRQKLLEIAERIRNERAAS
jgi:hypothetical protein